ncbi:MULTISPECIES: hypothetical protein [Nocardiopsis]|uniref:Uncharacterized protein n=2 Tax=Nocardiopsis changdeensis TaxID=2831969 RepID=A0ABX8BFE8_9ACTN|nr:MULTISPECIES: hypothetical protein [Nocardiopsis]QUX20974.1 hypothetical protein KGD84_21275 [Nocardiopsis changdeensis]QYX36905.1 hypothetical protein K1J57_30730 [Nocardiopsis sp. MT53]
MAIAACLALLFAVIAMLLTREEKKSWSAALRASFTTFLATMTALIAMVGVVFAVL